PDGQCVPGPPRSACHPERFPGVSRTWPYSLGRLAGWQRWQPPHVWVSLRRCQRRSRIESTSRRTSPPPVAAMPLPTITDPTQAHDRYPLLEPSQLDETKRVLSAKFADPAALCRELMSRGWLTPYQVNQLFQDGAAQLVLGAYVLQEKISESAMGDVFKARHQ